MKCFSSDLSKSKSELIQIGISLLMLEVEENTCCRSFRRYIMRFGEKMILQDRPHVLDRFPPRKFLETSPDHSNRGYRIGLAFAFECGRGE
jgi:hypothetical protein